MPATRRGVSCRAATRLAVEARCWRCQDWLRRSPLQTESRNHNADHDTLQKCTEEMKI